MPANLLIVTAVDAERDAMAAALAAGQKVGFGPYPALAGSAVTLVAGGVGPAAAAAATATVLALAAQPYHLVVSAGLGGGFAGRAGVGDVVEATTIVAGDLGADSPTGFLPLQQLGFGESEIAAAALGIPAARRGPVLTVSTVTGTAEQAARLAKTGALAEAMEGFGVAVSATRFGVAVGELRAVSNAVGPRERDRWDVRGALAVLARAALAVREASG